jgi:succinate dehydrogenase flavin-adding protein (antitoxin of CptAB toxin-antitoxin module)
MFGEKPAFIERLPDFHERVTKLKNGKTRCALTALMIGESVDKLTDFDNVLDWIPLDYVQLLSLATGSLVGTPWIELRDAQGGLVCRLHTQQWIFPFFEGHVALDNFCRGGIGRLLQQAPKELEADLRTAIQLAVHGGQRNALLDDRKTYMFRAFDTLTQKHRKREQVDKISEEKRKKITKILNTAHEDILKLRTKKKSSDEAQAIAAIADKVHKASALKAIDYAEAILVFLEELGFCDAKVIRDQVTAKTWTGRYKKYRGAVIHQGRLHIDDGREELGEIYSFASHLHDILLRVLLKLTNYDGEYKRVIRMQENKSLDWVQPNTPASDLGYKK